MKNGRKTMKRGILLAWFVTVTAVVGCSVGRDPARCNLAHPCLDKSLVCNLDETDAGEAGRCGPRVADASVPDSANGDGGDAGGPDSGSLCTPNTLRCMGSSLETCNGAGTAEMPMSCPKG